MKDYNNKFPSQANFDPMSSFLSRHSIWIFTLRFELRAAMTIRTRCDVFKMALEAADYGASVGALDRKRRSRFSTSGAGRGVADVTLGNIRRHSTGPRSCPNGSMSEEETSEKFNGRCGVPVLLLLFNDEAETPSLIASEHRSEISSFAT